MQRLWSLKLLHSAVSTGAGQDSLPQQELCHFGELSPCQSWLQAWMPLEMKWFRFCCCVLWTEAALCVLCSVSPGLQQPSSHFPPRSSGSQGSQGRARLSLMNVLVPVQSQASGAVCGLCACQASPSSCRWLPVWWVLCLGRAWCSGGGWVYGIHRRWPQEQPWLWRCFATYRAVPFPCGMNGGSLQCFPSSSRCVVAAGLHTATAATLPPLPSPPPLKDAIKQSKSVWNHHRHYTASWESSSVPTPTPSFLCSLWYFRSPVLC